MTRILPSTLATLVLLMSTPLGPATDQKPPAAASSATPAEREAKEVEFKVRVAMVELPGAMDTGLDHFDCHAPGPKEVLARVRRIEYLLEPPVEAPRDNAYFYEGTISRSKWPILARIHWSDRGPTTQAIKRP